MDWYMIGFLIRGSLLQILLLNMQAKGFFDT